MIRIDEGIETQREHLRIALRGNANAFWHLAWDLQFDPLTGRQVHPTSNDLRPFAGVDVLGDNVDVHLVAAVLSYLENGHDDRDGWLGKGEAQLSRVSRRSAADMSSSREFVYPRARCSGPEDRPVHC